MANNSYKGASAPYYDDIHIPGIDGLTPAEKFQRILFKPGSAVQARELTQIQSLLQNQLSHVGSHFFKEGSLVLPGHITHNNQLDYITVTLDTTGSSLNPISDAKNLINEVIYETPVNPNDVIQSPLKAKVHDVLAVGDNYRLYITYTSSNPERETSLFQADEIIGFKPQFKGITIVSNNQENGVIYKAARTSITSGIFYINKMFVVVPSHSTITNVEGKENDYSVGLKVTEEVIDITDDHTLGDTALGTNNARASGADRLKIKTELISVLSGNRSDTNFIELLRISDNNVIKKVDRTSYNILADELARRTADESGNYTIKPFTLNISNSSDGANFPTMLGKSKAYVQGYEIETIADIPLDIPVATKSEVLNTTVSVGQSPFVTVTSDLTGYYIPEKKLELYYTNNDVVTVVGQFRIISITSIPGNTADLNLNIKEFVFEPNYTIPHEFKDSLQIRQENETNEVIFNANVAVGGYSKIDTAALTGNIYEIKENGISLLSTTSEDSTEAKTGQVNYSVMAAMQGTVDSIDGTAATISLDVPVGYTLDNTKLVGTYILSATNIPSPVNGSGSGANTVIVNNTNLLEGDTVFTSAAVNETADKRNPKIKTLTEASVVSFSAATGNLDKYDVYDILSVVNGDDPEDTTDYKSQFILDRGYTDDYYKPSLLNLNPSSSSSLPDQLTVNLRYFKHSGSSDFFTRESYQDITDNSKLPTYYSEKYGKEISVGNIVDFRRESPNALNSTSTSTISLEPKSVLEVNTAVAFGRKDSIVLDTSGVFSVIKGTPSSKPVARKVPKNTIKLYELTIPANSLDASLIDIKRINNKRYTMRDVGKIESRVDRLEYYTSLSLLENQAMSDNIGNRLKAGFIVDDFTTHGRGDTTNPDYKCSVWPEMNALGPRFIEGNIPFKWEDFPGFTNLIENPLPPESDLNIRKTGDILTLDYESTREVSVSVLNATNFINVNPFNVFDFTGNVTISPATDDWKDTNRKPDVVFTQNSLYDAMLPLIDQSSIGTVWNEWETHWTGVSGSAEDRNAVPEWIGNTLTRFTHQDQTRSGISNVLTETNEVTDMGDRVVSVDLAPFMRARLISFKATGLKPNTKLFAFFDNINVTHYCRSESVFIDHNATGDYPADLMVENYGANWASIPYIGAGTHPAGVNELMSDDAGAITGSFWLPNNDIIKFNTGTKTFRLSDTGHRHLETTTASADYSATGLIENVENTSLSTRLPIITSSEVTGERDHVTMDVRHRDPLAQSFVLKRAEYPEGLFATSISVYFKRKDMNIPVTLEIREMQNGIPTQQVLPFSRVELTPDQVTEITHKTSGWGNLTEEEKYATGLEMATEFKFDSLVHLAPGVEYCFVLIANTDNYEIWYHRIGEPSFFTNEISASQLHTGVMFKSQNASTWEPDSESDIPFSISRAVFDTTSNGTVKLISDIPEYIRLKNNPITVQSVADVDNSNITKVFVQQDNHGFKVDDNVKLDGIISLNVSDTISGFAPSLLNTTHVIKGVNSINEYYIELDSGLRSVNTNTSVNTPTQWGTMQVGGNNVLSTYSIPYSEFYFGVAQIEPNGTSIDWVSEHALNSNSGTAYLNIDANVTHTDTNNVLTVSSNKDTSITPKVSKITGSLYSDNDLVSPIVDLDRMSYITINPVIDDTEVLASYITKPIVLANASNNIDVFLDYHCPTECTIKVKYQYKRNGDWVDIVDFPEGTLDNNNTLDEAHLESGEIQEFTVFRIKIEMFSTKQHIIPFIRNFRAIAGV
jgi:hypothetical protein